MYEFEEKYFNIFQKIVEAFGDKERKYSDLVDVVSAEYKKTVVEECIDFLIYNNSIKIVSKEKNIKKAIIKLEKKPNISKKLEVENGKITQLVLSSPPYDKAGLESSLETQNVQYAEIFTTFLDMIKSAEKCIKICSPFIEYNGFSLLEKEIRYKLEQGINVDILTRLEDIKTNPSRLREITKIKKSIGANKKNFRIYDYYHQYDGLLASSTHAKIIIVDNAIAYTGSGEIRKNSFKKNFELGLIVKGSLALDISKIFDYLLLVSEEITDYEFMA